MSSVALILLGSEHPGWLVEAARDALLAAELLFVDAAVPASWLAPLINPSAKKIEVEATDEARESARRQLVKRGHTGEAVARVYWRADCQDPTVLRDARTLHDAPVAFELFPGVEPAAETWSAWLAERPLFGRTVAILRMVGQASETADYLRTRGAEPWAVPTIELHPPPDLAPLRDALKRLSTYDMVAFTSANGVEQTFEVLSALGLDARAFGGCLVAAIGTVTAKRLAERGIVADVIAKAFRGEALAEGILESLGDPSGKRVLVPRALEAREILPDMLRDAGAEVDVIPAYQTLPPPAEGLEPLKRALAAGRVDAVLLTASSTVTNLCGALGEGYEALLANTCLASIGPITTDRATELGLTVRVEAEQFTIPGVISALESHFS